MAHVIIVSFIAVLGTGIAAITYLFSIQRSEGKFIHYRRHLVYLNLFVFVNILERYFKSNLLTYPGGFDLPRLIEVIVKGASVFCIVGLSYALIRMIRELHSQKTQNVVTGFFVTTGILCLLGYGAASTVYFIQNDHRWLHALYDSSIGVVIFATVLFLSHALFANRSNSNRNKKHLQNSLIIYYLCAFGIVFIANIIGYPTDLYVPTVIVFLINIFPFIWIRRWISQSSLGVIPIVLQQTEFDRITKEYGISDREKQLLELIVQGKSNDEIKDELFISIHTVKNHVYNLYRKFGVKSRGQLMRLLMEGR